MSKHKHICTAVLLLCMLTIAIANQPNIWAENAQTTDAINNPKLLNYQGRLTNLAGTAVADSTYSITFRLYNVSTSGSAFWTETQNVQTNQGIFNVLLGSNTPIDTIPQSGNCYLEMQVNPNPAMSPRIRLVSSAYAYLSKKADTANYALSANITYVDSARISANAHKLQGKDTIALSAKYVDEGQTNAITNPMIIDNAVTSAKIQDGTIQLIDLAFMPVTRPLTPPVATTEIADGAVTQGKIAAGVTLPPSGAASGDLTGTYPNPTITTNAVTTEKIATGAVSSAKILDATIINADISDGAVSSSKILDYTIQSDDIANLTITTGKIADNAITTAKIQDGQVQTSDIALGAVTTDKIQNNTILREDVASTFKAPYADTSDYTRNVNINYVDSARVATNTHKLQGKDTIALSNKYVDEGQSNSISSAMIIDNTITRSDVALTFKAPLADTADYARSTPPVGIIDSARVAVNAYNAFKLQGKDTIALSVKFVDEGQINAVTNPMIVDNAVTSTKILDGTIQTVDLAFIPATRPLTPPIVTAEIADGAVTQIKIASGVSLPPSGSAGGDLTGTYPNPTITTNAVTTAKISDNAVTSTKIQDGQVQTADIADLNVTTAKITDGAVNSVKLADNSVNSAKIVDGSIGTVDLNFTPATRPLSPGVATAEIADGAVTQGKIAAGVALPPSGSAGGDLTGTYPNPTITTNAVTTAKIADNAVITAKIADGANTLVKLADNSVNSAKIVDGSIRGADITKPCTLSYSSGTNPILQIFQNGSAPAVWINRAGHSGVYVDSAARGFTAIRPTSSGFVVDSSLGTGLFIRKTVNNAIDIKRTNADGLYIQKAEDDGIHIDSCNNYGLFVNNASYGIGINHTDYDGLSIGTTEWSGLYVQYSNWSGVEIGRANYDGIYVDSAGQRGGYFNNYNNDYYTIEAINHSGTGASIKGLYVQGAGHSTGGWSTVLSEDKTGFSVISPEIEIMISGTSYLSEGFARVNLDSKTQKSLSDNIPLKVIVTPNSECNGIFVTDKSSAGFTVKELVNGKSNASFDWIVIGRMKGYEQTPDNKPTIYREASRTSEQKTARQKNIKNMY